MPHVASETRAHGLNYARPSPSRPGPAEDRAQGSTFESLLEDNAAADRAPPQAAPERPRAESADPKRETAQPEAKASVDGNAESTEPVAGDVIAAPESGDDAAEVQIKPGAVIADAAQPVAGEPQLDGEAIAAPAPPVTAEATGEGEREKSATKPAAASEPDEVQADGEALPVTAHADADATDDSPKIETVKQGVDQITTATATAQATPQAVPTPAAESVSADAPKSAAPAQAAVVQAATVKVNATTGDKTAGKPAASEAPADDTALPAPEERGIQAATPETARKADAHARGETPANAQRAAAPEPSVPPPVDAARAAPKADVVQAPSFVAPPQQTASAAGSYAAAAVAQPAQPMPQAAAVPLAGIAIDIAGKALAGKHHFEIRLDPPELGRIEVRLEIDRDGRITSHLLADRRDTLDMLRRDSASLERALQDAGLKTGDNGLQFSLRDRSADAQPERTGGAGARVVIEDDTLPLIETAQSRFAARRGGIDIRI